MVDQENKSPYEIQMPEHQTRPFVLNSPHSGKYYLEEFVSQSRLSSSAIRSSEDFMVDELIRGAIQWGMPLLSAEFPRAYLDVNREPYELDPAMFEDELPHFANTRSVRVASGLGTIAKIVAEGQDIYQQKLRVTEALSRIENVYKPYHAALRGLLARTHVQFGCAVLLDFHSMPSATKLRFVESRPDIILGDRFGKSCAPALMHHARSILQGLGYHVELNKPYAGGFITEHYGRPDNGLHALQLEINRGLYMNELKLEPNAGFEQLREDLTWFISQLSEIDINELFGGLPLAAE